MVKFWLRQVDIGTRKLGSWYFDYVKFALRPDVYSFKDYRAFLRAQVEYLASRKTDARQQKDLARLSGLSPSSISMFMNGKRRLKGKNFQKLAGTLGLSASEESFLQKLYIIAESRNPEERIEALRGIEKFKEYKRLNQKEVQTFSYLDSWENVVIREMTNLHQIEDDASKVFERLLAPTTLQRVRQSLEFLKRNQFLSTDSQGILINTQRSLDCTDEILSTSLVNFHKQMLALLSERLVNKNQKHRFVEGYTFAVKNEDYPKVLSILNETLNRLEELESKAREGEKVVHCVVAAVPLAEVPSRPSVSPLKIIKEAA